MVPAESSAANAVPLDVMETKPLPAGALLPPYEECPHALMAPEESSAAKAYTADAMETKPLPVGAPLLLLPHALIVPEAWSAAKAESVDAMETKPLPVGALLPPELGEPHALMAPAESSAANAPEFDAIEMKPLPVGAAPVPPLDHSPHEWMVPEASSTAKALLFACCPLQRPGYATTPVRKWTSMRSTNRGAGRRGKARPVGAPRPGRTKSDVPVAWKGRECGGAARARAPAAPPLAPRWSSSDDRTTPCRRTISLTAAAPAMQRNAQHWQWAGRNGRSRGGGGWVH